jgi:hypothetical protein
MLNVEGVRREMVEARRVALFCEFIGICQADTRHYLEERVTWH